MATADTKPERSSISVSSRKDFVPSPFHLLAHLQLNPNLETKKVKYFIFLWGEHALGHQPKKGKVLVMDIRVFTNGVHIYPLKRSGFNIIAYLPRS